MLKKTKQLKCLFKIFWVLSSYHLNKDYTVQKSYQIKEKVPVV